MLRRTPSTTNSVWSELAPRMKTELCEPTAPLFTTVTPGVPANAVRKSVTCMSARAGSENEVTLLAANCGSWGVRVADTTTGLKLVTSVWACSSKGATAQAAANGIINNRPLARTGERVFISAPEFARQEQKREPSADRSFFRPAAPVTSTPTLH